MSEKEKMVAQGTCRYCGQLRNVMYWSAGEEMPRARLDNIASQECNCEGARRERAIEEDKATCTEFINREVEKKFPDIADHLVRLLDPVARRQMESVVIKRENYTFKIYQPKDGYVSIMASWKLMSDPGSVVPLEDEE